MILDKFSRRSFLVEATSGELNPPGWTRGPFGLFLDRESRWVLTHLPSRKVFLAKFPTIESACEAVLKLEALPIDWEHLPKICPREVLAVIKKFGKVEDPFEDLKKRLQEFL